MKKCVILLFLFFCSVGVQAGEVLVFKGQTDSLHCRLEITYKTSKIIDVVFTVLSDSGFVVTEKRCSAKLYPGSYESDRLLEFPSDVFTCAFDCPMTILLERGSQIRAVLRDEGCFTYEGIAPDVFGVLFRDFTADADSKH